ncbi:hypothetical protein C8Q76DRAFT_799401 [Earliella scabrosa]|nr:hypothetical protein C8Q76DRAFT_799401 [Earliella scabrosa]
MHLSPSPHHESESTTATTQGVDDVGSPHYTRRQDFRGRHRTVTSKDAYEEQYQGMLKEVIDTRKEARNASWAAILTGRTGKDRQKDNDQVRDDDKDSTDLDRPADAKGKGQKQLLGESRIQQCKRNSP